MSPRTALTVTPEPIHPNGFIRTTSPTSTHCAPTEASMRCLSMPAERHKPLRSVPTPEPFGLVSLCARGCKHVKHSCDSRAVLDSWYIVLGIPALDRLCATSILTAGSLRSRFLAHVASTLPYDEVKETSGAANGTNIRKTVADSTGRGWGGWRGSRTGKGERFEVTLRTGLRRVSPDTSGTCGSKP